jgi:hypothetical protein
VIDAAPQGQNDHLVAEGGREAARYVDVAADSMHGCGFKE